MRTLLQNCFVCGLLALAVAFASAEAGDKKVGPPAVGSLPPHPLDELLVENGNSKLNALLIFLRKQFS